MVLGANLLNSDASLNSFFTIGSLDFVPGSGATLVIQLEDLQKDIRFVPPIAATLSISINQTDGTVVNKAAAVLDPGDRSIWVLQLSSSDTLDILSGNFMFTLDVNGDASLIVQGQVQNGLRSLLLQC